jgi:carboxyl-terminal processing protease
MSFFKKIALVFAFACLSSRPASAVLAPNPGAPMVGQLVARFLEEDQYDHHPIDVEVSQNFLLNYLEAFDYNHMFFLKGDVAEFKSRYGDNLGDRLKNGDISPAFDIFDRFLLRLEDRQSYAVNLASTSFDFDKNDMIVLDRHKLPWPATQAESDKLWRARVKYEFLEEILNKTKPKDQAKEVRDRYVRLLKSYKEFDSSDILQEYLSALTHAYDPHSDYMAQEQKENFDISMRLSLVGIGAVLRESDGYAQVVSLVPGGPADKNNRLKPKDKIEAVSQGVDGPWLGVTGMRLDHVVEQIRGKKGSVVRLRVIPANAIDRSTRVIITIMRDEIKLTDQEAKAEILEGKDSSGALVKIGVIDLPSFYEDMKSGGEKKSTTRDVKELLEALQKKNIQGLILDLRQNGGGALSEAISLTGLFIPSGPVVQVKDARGVIRSLDHSNSMIYSGPMAVLTSRASASASEIFAAALQDYGRAIIIGDKKTFGKGTVQTLIDLSQDIPRVDPKFGPGALKLTIQKFYRVSGGSTQNKGVIPDVQLPSIEDYMDIAESALENALPYDEVDPVSHTQVGDALPELVNSLDVASKARVTASREFGYVRQDIALFKKEDEGKIASLNEKERLKEKSEAEALDEQRKKERLAVGAGVFFKTKITLESLEGKAVPVASLSPSSPKKPEAAATGKGVKPTDKKGTYDKASPAPDIVLEESVRVVQDMIHPDFIPRELAQISEKMRVKAATAASVAREQEKSAAALNEILP